MDELDHIPAHFWRVRNPLNCEIERVEECSCSSLMLSSLSSSSSIENIQRDQKGVGEDIAEFYCFHPACESDFPTVWKRRDAFLTSRFLHEILHR